MYTFIVFDTNTYWHRKIQDVISLWMTDRDLRGITICVNSKQELFCFLNNITDTEVILIDVQYGDSLHDGVSLAKSVRKINDKVPIILVSSDGHRATEGYEIGVINFIVKNSMFEQKLTWSLSRIFDQRLHENIIIQTEDSIISVPDKKIVMVEVNDHILTFYTDDQIYSSRGRLCDMDLKLNMEKYVQINRSQILAINRIKCINRSRPYKITVNVNSTELFFYSSRKYINQTIYKYTNWVDKFSIE